MEEAAIEDEVLPFPKREGEWLASRKVESGKLEASKGKVQGAGSAHVNEE
jgi:hypothetical protein